MQRDLLHTPHGRRCERLPTQLGDRGKHLEQSSCHWKNVPIFIPEHSRQLCERLRPSRVKSHPLSKHTPSLLHIPGLVLISWLALSGFPARACACSHPPSHSTQETTTRPGWSMDCPVLRLCVTPCFWCVRVFFVHGRGLPQLGSNQSHTSQTGSGSSPQLF